MVPVDGSKTASEALKKAVELQKMCGSELMILTVFRHHSLLEASLSMVRPQEPENMDDILRGYAKEVAEAAKTLAIAEGSKAPRAFVKRGPPARTIITFGKEHEADLIVLGSRGTGDFEDFLLGSVSHKVSGLAECPVMLV